MTAVPLTAVLTPALAGAYAVPGFVCQGWEDSRAYVAAAEAAQSPVILQAGPGARAHTPLPILGAIFRHLADTARVPVVLHLDHATTIDECRAALDAGFTSLMFDGSRLPLADNIAQTRAVADLAHAHGAGCEGEIGFVGYAGGAQSHGTDPAEAALFARDTQVDALAISVGNLHLQTEATGQIDRPRLRAIEEATAVPLVLHGGSGLPPALRHDLATTSRVCKFNIGTELRQTFGQALRAALAADPAQFDRIALLSATEPPLRATATRIFTELGSAGRA